MRALDVTGKNVTFRDVRAEPLSREQILRFLEAFGDDLVNRRSTTWRSLDEDERQAPFEQLLAEKPALMKRPIIDDGEQVTLGWDKAVQKRHLG
jgi:arsenate reductase-like glutaredoxin family protein